MHEVALRRERLTISLYVRFIRDHRVHHQECARRACVLMSHVSRFSTVRYEMVVQVHKKYLFQVRLSHRPHVHASLTHVFNERLCCADPAYHCARLAFVLSVTTM